MHRRARAGGGGGAHKLILRRYEEDKCFTMPGGLFYRKACERSGLLYKTTLDILKDKRLDFDA